MKSINLKTLEERLDERLSNETEESLTNWLNQKRNKMMSKTVKRLLDSTPKDVEIFVRWYSALTLVINRLIEQKNVDREIPEIQEYMSGTWDLRLLSRLSGILDYPFISINTEVLDSEGND